jgi:hypothetical protein
MNPLARSLPLLIAAALTSACSGDANITGQLPECGANSDCSSGLVCGPDKKCTQGCDPRAVQNTCGAGRSCDPQGRCVDSTTSCNTNADCTLVEEAEPVCEANTEVTPRAVGRCIDQGDGPRCAYEDRRQPCTTGCDATTGRCVPPIDPCEGIVCDSPPAARCDGNALRTFSGPGTCNSRNGMCSYPDQRMSCVAGCENAMCRMGTCVGVTCDMPPANRCADDDPNVLISYDASGMCMEEGGAPSCNYPTTRRNCAYSGGSCQGSECANTKQQVGPLVITEYMVNPAHPLNNTAHQWFEVINTGASAVDLNQWVIRSAGGEQHLIDAGGPNMLTIAAGARAVFASSANPLGDASLTPLRSYGADIRLSNEDSIELVDPEGRISDFVYWEAGSTLQGRSRKLSPDAPTTPEGNDDFTRWCPSLSGAIGQDAANFGSPGAANTPCVADPCGTIGCSGPPANFCNSSGDAVAYTEPNPTCSNSRFLNPLCDYRPMTTMCAAGTTLCVQGACIPIPNNLPAPGEVIFTELMGDPEVAPDADGDWLELYNTTDRALSLFSLTIEDNESGAEYTSQRITDPAVTIPAKGYLVFAASTDPARNGGIMGARRLVAGLLKNMPNVDPMTGQSTMRIRLVRSDMTLIDEVFYGRPTAGASQQLSSAAYVDNMDAATNNDSAANFCAATDAYNGTDRGTPGAANIECP